MRRAAVGVFCAGLTVVVFAQQAPRYVAEVTENRSAEPGDDGSLFPGGGFKATHISAERLIKTAHRVESYQIVGLPDWARTTYYDVKVASVAQVGWPETFAMVRQLLQDRFHLTFHRDQRMQDGFALAQLVPDRFGRALRRSTVSCGMPDQPAPCSANSLVPGELRMVGWDMTALAGMLSRYAGRQIVDETKLSGTFDAVLRWSPAGTAPSAARPELASAVEQQLGLTLRSKQVPVDAFVIDRLERPKSD